MPPPDFNPPPSAPFSLRTGAAGAMNTIHILRKYRPEEWGGTETAVKRLLDGLKDQGVHSRVLAPAAPSSTRTDPFAASGHLVERFHAFLPVWGLGEDQKAQLLSVGGNLMSFELPRMLLRDREIDLIHTHALNRFGGIALRCARLRKIPCVVTIHGGYLDLPDKVRDALAAPLRGGFEWGRIFGPILRSRHVVEDADAVITCNPREAELIRQKFPGKKILVQPHGVPISEFDADHTAAALTAYPILRQRRTLLVLGRIDPVKNQGWVLQQFPAIRRQFPDALLVFAGAATDELYAKGLKKEIRRSGLEESVLMTGGLPPLSPVLLGLLQQAAAVIIPSLSETFGLTILEAWAARRPVLSTNTSGAVSLIEDFKNGLLFNLAETQGFQKKLKLLLEDTACASKLAAAGRARAEADFDSAKLAARVKDLYLQLLNKP